MPKQRIRVDVYYEVSGHNLLEARRGWMVPRKVQVMLGEHDPVTVIVSGPMRTKNGLESSQNGRVIFGRFGIPMSEAPQWARDIAAEVEQMAGSRAQA